VSHVIVIRRPSSGSLLFHWLEPGEIPGSTLPSVFEFEDYKTFVRDCVSRTPSGGRGQFRRMAKHLRVHTTLLSHVFRGSKDLTLEQACALGSFLQLSELDADYLLALVERRRAGTHALASAIDRRLTELRRRHQELEHRIPSRGARRNRRECDARRGTLPCETLAVLNIDWLRL
jgi:hypothetical protein